ncbi:winged helix-turn-helix domain-containing protein [Streptomyces sp. SCSIO 30461]|uniref:winged helix-turn-helix domain-containing protein n=1 Tax=Streptomyces sp. SCSIO 30461 TaxID=3118085 RepID=UPI0030CD2F01
MCREDRPFDVCSSWEVCLSESAIRSARFTSPVLFALGGLNAWAGQTAGDYLAVSAGFCVPVCAAGLFGEDLLRRGYRGDRVVLAYVARHPGATTGEVAQAVGMPERRVRANLGRLRDDGLLAVTSDGASGAPRPYLLPSLDSG